MSSNTIYCVECHEDVSGDADHRGCRAYGNNGAGYDTTDDWMSASNLYTEELFVPDPLPPRDMLCVECHKVVEGSAEHQRCWSGKYETYNDWISSNRLFTQEVMRPPGLRPTCKGCRCVCPDFPEVGVCLQYSSHEAIERYYLAKEDPALWETLKQEWAAFLEETNRILYKNGSTTAPAESGSAEVAKEKND